MAPTIVDDYHRRAARDGLAPDPAQLAVAQRLDRLAAALADYRPKRPGPRWLRLLPGNGEARGPRGLYLWGAVGRGKTMLLDLFHANAPVAARRRVHFHAFMQEVHGRLHDIRQKQRSGHIWDDADPVHVIAEAVASESWLLCFDELQVTDIADAMILGRLFEALIAHGVVIVATSNTPPAELYRDGLNRNAFLPFIAMLEARLDVVELASPRDYRLDTAVTRTLYVAPLGAAAARAIDRLWGELTEGEGEGPRALSVNGRRLEVGLAAGGVARFTFAELCGRPLGAADYLAIAEAFHTVIVENVPRLAPDRRDEARRLTVLVDTLYDRRRRLVVSAATAPEDIFVGPDRGLGFARTVSRLSEMGSEAYWRAAAGGD